MKYFCCNNNTLLYTRQWCWTETQGPSVPDVEDCDVKGVTHFGGDVLRSLEDVDDDDYTLVIPAQSFVGLLGSQITPPLLAVTTLTISVSPVTKLSMFYRS